MSYGTNLAETFDLYEGRDPREVPAYSFREVALCA